LILLGYFEFMVYKKIPLFNPSEFVFVPYLYQ
jgi:hypothetical protein